MKKIYETIHKAVCWYTVLMAPVVIVCSRWFMHGEALPKTLLERALNTAGFAWVLSLFYLIGALVFYKKFRDGLLARLSGFKERDEREQQVTGDAAKSTFLLMLAIEIVFLAFSMTSFELVRRADGHGVLNVGMGLSSAQTDLFAPNPEPAISVFLLPGGATVLKARLLPPAVGGVMLLLVFMQLLAFRLFAVRGYGGRADACQYVD